MCHIFLLLPILALPVFLILPWQEAMVVYAGVCLFSAAFYWMTWRTIHRQARTGVEGMMGGIGTVFRSSDGKTKVFYHGEIWDAVGDETMSLGGQVEIIGVERMTLVVRRRA